MIETESLPKPLLPPDSFRHGNCFWRINTGIGEGYALVVSSRIPMCHITGSDADFHPRGCNPSQPLAFLECWERTG